MEAGHVRVQIIRLEATPQLGHVGAAYSPVLTALGSERGSEYRRVVLDEVSQQRLRLQLREWALEGADTEAGGGIHCLPLFAAEG